MKLQDLTLKQIGNLCANQNDCPTCPLYNKDLDWCQFIYYFAPYSIGQELLDIEIDDSLLEENEPSIPLNDGQDLTYLLDEDTKRYHSFNNTIERK